MKADALFLRRCRQIATLLESRDEVDLLDLSKNLRQMLCDQYSLVDQVNIGRDKVKLVFRVGTLPYPPDKHTTLMFIDDGIDADGPRFRTGRPVLSLSIGNFLNHTVLYSHPMSVTIKDVIKHAAEAAGGVHYSPKSKKHRVMQELSRKVVMMNLPLGMTMLRAIARVTIRGLDPLINSVEARQQQRST